MKSKMVPLFFLFFVFWFFSFANAGQLVYSTFLGGSNDDFGMSIAVDSAGNAYITGYSSSPDYPTTSGAYDTTFNGNYDVSVTKINPTGSTLLYSTFVGGSDADYGRSITVDNAGNAYITGYTSSSTDFPTTPSAFETTYNGGYSDAFVCKIDSVGANLLYSTFLGGSSADRGYNIAIDTAENAYITGRTGSTDFPTTTGAMDTIYNGNASDNFVTKLNFNGTALVYSTFLGGSERDYSFDVAVDSIGNAYITGYTLSSDFPTTAGAFDTIFNDITGYTGEVFVSKLNTNGSTLLYSTFLGGNFYDESYSITVDNTGHAYITGFTTSDNFPITANAFDTIRDGYYDIFVSKLNETGTALVYSTFLGGYGDEVGNGIAVDTNGNAFITGYTNSFDFPITPGAFDTTYNGSNDIFVSQLNAAGSALLYSTYLGGSNTQYGNDILVDKEGNVSVIGYTNSANFPTTHGSVDTIYNGNQDIFVTKLSLLIGNFYGTPTIGYIPLPVQFYDTSSGLPNSWYWTFGDGSISTEQNPIHLYTNAGIYSVTLIASDAYVAETVTRVNYISVYPSSLPIAEFYAIPITGVKPLTIQFYDASFGIITSWYWTFGDGSTSNEQNPTHTYINAGNYTVSLVARNIYGPGTTTKIDYISVDVPDPAVLLYSTFLGGSGGDYGYSIAVDTFGNAYITGASGSTAFPTTIGAYDTSFNSGLDVFISKLNPAGSALIYSTFLGGGGNDEGHGIAVDSAGNTYITGITSSSDFPTTAGAFDETANGANDVFVSKLNSIGSGLLYSTFLGGSSSDLGYALAIDATGNAYITGHTYLTNFPVTPGAFDISKYNNSSPDAFVTKLNQNGSALDYSTYLGEGGYDFGWGIVVDNGGNAYVTGHTASSNFPTTPGAFDTSYNGGNSDIFVCKFNPYGSALVYSTFIGGGDNDTGCGIALDNNGDAYVTGWTESANFPTTSAAYDNSFNGASDIIVSKLNQDGSALVYSTFLGGNAAEGENTIWGGIAIDEFRNAYIIGWTNSNNFPTTFAAFDTSGNGGTDIFITKLNSYGATLLYSTYLGGNGSDIGCDIAVDATGNAYITGYTTSFNFPTSATPFDNTYNGDYDGFVSKLHLVRPTAVEIPCWLFYD